MPTYEYECRACHHVFEQFQAMSDEPVKICPVCGKHEVKRLIGGGTGIIFKGSGFYCTDNKNGNGGAVKTSGKTDEAEKPMAESTVKADDAKATESKAEEKKPEAKPAAKEAASSPTK
jgi:putative FmdB family regulatory protein